MSVTYSTPFDAAGAMGKACYPLTMRITFWRENKKLFSSLYWENNMSF
jgi:hypothetical protein